MEKNNFHPYGNNLEKFHNKVVMVKDVFNETYKGKCIAINKFHLNIILETPNEIVVIKNPMIIKRSLEYEPKEDKKKNG